MIVGGQQQRMANFNSVGAGYFRAMATPLIAGRDFDERDNPKSPKVVIVSETFAKRYFPGQSAVGKSFQIAEPVGEPRPFYEIVGVAKDSKYSDLREAFTPVVFMSLGQSDEPDLRPRFVVHATTTSAALTTAITQVLTGVNLAIAVEHDTVWSQVNESPLSERLMATLSGFFGGLAVLLDDRSAWRMSYTVARRGGDRHPMALGADRRQVVRMIVGEALRLLAREPPPASRCRWRGALGGTLLYDVKPWILSRSRPLSWGSRPSRCWPVARAARIAAGADAGAPRRVVVCSWRFAVSGTN